MDMITLSNCFIELRSGMLDGLLGTLSIHFVYELAFGSASANFLKQMFGDGDGYNLEDGKVTRTYHERYIMVENGKLVFSLMTVGLSILEFDMEANQDTFEVLQTETYVICWLSMVISVVLCNPPS